MNKASPRSSATNTRREAQFNRPSTASSSKKSYSSSNGFSRQNSNNQIRASSRMSSRSGCKTKSLSKTHQFTTESYLNDPECISIRDSLFNDSSSFDDIETPQMLRLLSHLREYTQFCALNEDYKTSKKSRNLANQVREELTKRGTQHYSIQEQKDEIDARISDFEERWSRKREDFSNETEKRMNDLNNRQQHELRKFERIWKEEMPHKYRKPSVRLLQLKQIEKNLAMTGEIDEADRIHGISEIRMKYEMEEAQNQLSVDYEAAKVKLFQKQYEEKQKFHEQRNHENNLLEANYRSEKAKFNNRNFVITSRCHKVASKTHVSKSVNSLPTTLPRDKGIPLGTLLPPLIPPNDPNFMANKRRKREEIARKKREYQKKNAVNILTQYSMDFREKLIDSQNENESQITDNDQNKDESQITDNDQNKDESQITDNDQNKEELQNTDDDQNEEESQKVDDDQNKDESQKVDDDQNKEESQKVGDDQNKEELQNNSENKNADESQNINEKENENTDLKDSTNINENENTEESKEITENQSKEETQNISKSSSQQIVNLEQTAGAILNGLVGNTNNHSNETKQDN